MRLVEWAQHELRGGSTRHIRHIRCTHDEGDANGAGQTSMTSSGPTSGGEPTSSDRAMLAAPGSVSKRHARCMGSRSGARRIVSSGGDGGDMIVRFRPGAWDISGCETK